MLIECLVLQKQRKKWQRLICRNKKKDLMSNTNKLKWRGEVTALGFFIMFGSLESLKHWKIGGRFRWS